MYVPYWLFLWRTLTNTGRHSETFHISCGVGPGSSLRAVPSGQHTHPVCFLLSESWHPTCGSSLPCESHSLTRCGRMPFSWHTLGAGASSFQLGFGSNRAGQQHLSHQLPGNLGRDRTLDSGSLTSGSQDTVRASPLSVAQASLKPLEVSWPDGQPKWTCGWTAQVDVATQSQPPED